MSGNLTHVLFENASGYSLFEVNIQEEVAAKSKAVQDAVLDFSKFSRMVKLKSFLPFTSAAEALANANDVSEGEPCTARSRTLLEAVESTVLLHLGIVSEQLSSLLQLLIPSSSKSSPRVLLGIGERTLASSISQQLKIPCDTGERTLELVRGVRLHAELFLSKAGTGMTKGDVKMAQLGLGHSYSRGKVKVSYGSPFRLIATALICKPLAVQRESVR
jgi:nucleolar protein 56